MRQQTCAPWCRQVQAGAGAGGIPAGARSLDQIVSTFSRQWDGAFKVGGIIPARAAGGRQQMTGSSTRVDGHVSQVEDAHAINAFLANQQATAAAFDTHARGSWQLAQEGPEEALNSTDNTQPLLLTAGVALWKLWEQAGGARPDRLAGHSLGEYTALTCAGVISLGDAVRLVRRRGELMQAAVAEGEGRMAAILGLDDDQVRQACADAAQGEVVEAADEAPARADGRERVLEVCVVLSYSTS